MNQIILVVALLFITTPALAHEGSNAEHLLLGLDSGVVIGTLLGFGLGVASTLLYLKRQRQ